MKTFLRVIRAIQNYNQEQTTILTWTGKTWDIHFVDEEEYLEDETIEFLKRIQVAHIKRQQRITQKFSY